MVSDLNIKTPWLRRNIFHGQGCVLSDFSLISLSREGKNYLAQGINDPLAPTDL